VVNLGLAAGATIVVMPRFDMGEFLRLLEEHRVTRAHVAPPVVLGLTKAPGVEGPRAGLARRHLGCRTAGRRYGGARGGAARRAGAPGLRDPDELMAWVAERVAPHKRVRAVELVEEVPRSASGKILRRLLRDAGPGPGAQS
jgi:acyl-coenzyme A synthetase/AMP-(fatty) acid ligase